MRSPTDFPMPQRRPITRRQKIIAVVVGLLILLILSLRGIAHFYTDYLWFKEVGFNSVWSKTLRTKMLLGLMFSAAAFAFILINFIIARRLAPKTVLLRPQDEAIRRFRDRMRTRGARVVVIVSAILGVLTGSTAYLKWNDWFLFTNAVSFGAKDPQFHKDISFFVFKLPFYTFLIQWLFGLALFTVLIITAFHYLQGGVQMAAAKDRVSTGMRAHISFLLGLLALIKAIDYYFERFELNFSTRGYVSGAGYTDVHAVLPALNFLILIALFAAILFFVNVGVRRWSLPILAVALWMVIQLVVAGIYPQLVQRFRVTNAEQRLEEPYIARNIKATSDAMGLSKIKETSYPFKNDLGQNVIAENKDTLENVRIWNPANAKPSFQRLQGETAFYKFNDVDIDRYKINGKTQQVVIGARELDPGAELLNRWTSKHLQYTHGYGVAVAPTHTADDQGDPNFEIKNVPLETSDGAPKLTQPAIYFGDDQGSYVIANSKQKEIDYIENDTNRYTSYQGKGGVQLDNVFKKAAFALRFSDINPLISSEVDAKSRMMFNRNVQLRVHTAAPFLRLDADPYPVIANGRIVWVLDAFTTTNQYPYALRTSNQIGSFNYIRNSVKATVDAYDGSVKLYVIDNKDPLIRAWRKAFPKLFVDGSEMPKAIQEHLRYPDDLFKVQSEFWGAYHIQDPQDFYGKSDTWRRAQDPQGGTEEAISTDGRIISAGEARMAPYYLLMAVPGETKQSFVTMQSFVPFSRDDSRRELVSFLIAKADPGEFGQLVSYRLPRNVLPPGPADIANRIDSNSAASKERTLIGQQGSQVIKGDLIVLPIGNSIVYVEPWFLQANQSSTKLPQLKNVVAVYNNKIALGNTFNEAILKVFSGNANDLGTGSTSSGSKTSGATTTTIKVSDSQKTLIAKAAQALAEADQARLDGDLGKYQAKVAEAKRYLDQANSK